MPERSPVEMARAACFFSVTDRYDFEMTETNLVISVRMSENIG